MKIQSINYPYNYLRTTNKSSSTPYYKDTVSFSAYYTQRVKRRKKAQKIGAFISALTVGIAGATGIAFKVNSEANLNENKNSNDTTPPSSYAAEPFETEEPTLPEPTI